MSDSPMSEARPIISARLRPGWERAMDPSSIQAWRPQPFLLRGGETHVVAMGKGPPMLLIPPLPGFKEAWLRCFPALAEQFRVVTYDLRVRFDGRPTWAQMLEDLERIADAHAPGEAIVIGHSLGGALAQQWSLVRPERVRALVLSSSFARVHTPRGQRVSRFVAQPLVLGSQRYLPRALALPVARWLAGRAGWVFDHRCDDGVLELVRFCIRDISYGGVRNMLELAFSHDSRTQLGQIRCPTLIVIAERESAFVHHDAELFLHQIPGAERRTSPGASHLHPLSSSGWFVENVSAWWQEQLRRDRAQASEPRNADT